MATHAASLLTAGQTNMPDSACPPRRRANTRSCLDYVKPEIAAGIDRLVPVKSDSDSDSALVGTQSVSNVGQQAVSDSVNI